MTLIGENEKMQSRLDGATVAMFQSEFQSLVQDSNDIFGILTTDGTIQYINPAIRKILGFIPEEQIGKHITKIFNDPEGERFSKMLNTLLDQPTKRIKQEIILQSKQGQKVYFELFMLNCLSGSCFQAIILSLRDITEWINNRDKVTYLMTHDRLTNLPNHDQLLKKLKAQCERAKAANTTVALMRIDFDGLRNINNALGYQLEDQLIIQKIQRIKDFLNNEELFFRTRKDGFCIIVPGLRSVEEYECVAQGIIGLFSQSFKIHHHELYITINIGISIYPNDTHTPEGILKNANNALLQVKKEGKNRYKRYSSKIDIESYKQFMLRNDIRTAIEKNQFRVYYQPLVDLQTSKIIAAEAFIRWEHPIWGLLQPNEFIFLAEEMGYIITLGNWMIREVCHNYKQWLERKLPDIKVAVNFSRFQFFEKNLAESIKSIFTEFQLDPHFFIMEIKESTSINDSEAVKSDFENMRSMGIQVALDNFGTCSSSFSLIKDLPIDILKIDRSIISEILSNHKSTIITQSIISLGKELELQLVAEGIENFEQLAFLRKLNCPVGQGYLYSKPVPHEEFMSLLNKKKCKTIPYNEVILKQEDNRRKFFRIGFTQLLEADMTVLQLLDAKVDIGTTKVLVKNMGPGGLWFISDIKLPIHKNIILHYVTQLLGEEIKVYGHIVWAKESAQNLYEYGLEFTIDESERNNLTKVLNQIQLKMKNNPKCITGRFILLSAWQYFSHEK